MYLFVFFCGCLCFVGVLLDSIGGRRIIGVVINSSYSLFVVVRFSAVGSVFGFVYEATVVTDAVIVSWSWDVGKYLVGIVMHICIDASAFLDGVHDCPE